MTKTLRVTTPIMPDIDLVVLRWLTRESFEKRAADLSLEMVDYTETDVPEAEIPRKTREAFPGARWIKFEATCKYPDEIQALLDERYGPRL
ncbi:hypothetical protein [Mycolicibacterium sp.]|uniref:hypothetical protein n=1 Tax=Mycolicibacterium sp. TaxID=2320850 RepID=UPI0037CB71DA